MLGLLFVFGLTAVYRHVDHIAGESGQKVSSVLFRAQRINPTAIALEVCTYTCRIWSIIVHNVWCLLVITFIRPELELIVHIKHQEHCCFYCHIFELYANVYKGENTMLYVIGTV